MGDRVAPALSLATRVLVDTHVLVWALVEPGRLSAAAIEVIDDPAVRVSVSAVVAYEIELKRAREPLFQRLPKDIVAAARKVDYQWLDITGAHAAAAGRLPRHHGDPFDRMMIAQALSEKLPFISKDRNLSAYEGLTVIW